MSIVISSSSIIIITIVMIIMTVSIDNSVVLRLLNVITLRQPLCGPPASRKAGAAINLNVNDTTNNINSNTNNISNTNNTKHNMI